MQKLQKKLLGVLIAGTFGALAAAAGAHDHKAPAPAQPAQIKLAPLAIGQTQAIQLDQAQLLALKPNQSFRLQLGQLGSLPLIFEHATAEVNGVSYWEAHLDGDLQQRVSLKLDHGAVSGSIMLKQNKLVLGHADGKSFVTRFGNDYQPEQQQVAQANIFQPQAKQADAPRAYPSEQPAKASWPVSFNAAQLKNMALNSEVALNLPDGRTLAIVHDQAETSDAGNYTFIGYVRDQGTNHRVVLTADASGNAYGVINLPSGEIRVESSGCKQWLVDVEKSGLTYAPLAEPLQPLAESGSLSQAHALANKAMAEPASARGNDANIALTPVAMADSDTTVDLLVVYSPGMVSRLGGDGAARARIDNLVAITNQIMADSQVATRMRLVHARQINQADNVNQGTLLSALANDSGGFAGVRALRDQYGADLVQFIHKPTAGVGSCGIGYLSVSQGPRGNAGSGFSVVDDSCRNHVMAHELGHNFGNNHDHAQGGGTPVYPYSWGYIIPGTDYGDVMSYAGTRYYKYSNPRIGGCSGQACGVNNWADAAQSMKNVRGIVAGYRPTRVVDGGGGVGNGRYQIQAVHSGKCVDVAGWSTADGGNILQWSCHGGANQLFDVRATGSGDYTLVNAHSGKCADVAGWSTADGGNILQWSCHGGANQRFSIRAAGNGEYSLVNSHSGKCVDVTNGSADGGDIVQWSCHGGANQRFRFLQR